MHLCTKGNRQPFSITTLHWILILPHRQMALAKSTRSRSIVSFELPPQVMPHPMKNDRLNDISILIINITNSYKS